MTKRQEKLQIENEKKEHEQQRLLDEKKKSEQDELKKLKTFDYY